MSFSTIKTFDPYAVMDLDRTATIDEIKSKFRKLTLMHHPDRNRRKRGYNPKVYDDICKAYAILSDPHHRQEFDNQFASTWLDLREANKDFITDQQKQSRSFADLQIERSEQSSGIGGVPESFAPRQKFGEGDLAAFNDMFDKSRTADPNDHGYGNEMAGRMTEQEAKSWSSSVSEIRHENLFQGQSFSDREFNRLFDEKISRDASKEIIERSDADPSAFSLASQHAFTDIALHDGRMIIGRDTRDYSKQATAPSDLSYVDYMQGFQTISSQVPEGVKKQYTNEENVDRLFQQRMAEHSSNPYDEIPENERKSFAEAKEAMINRKLREIERENKMQRDVVLKYKSQYRDNYLEHKNPRNQETNNRAPRHQETIHHQPHQPRHRETIHQPHQPPRRIQMHTAQSHQPYQRDGNLNQPHGFNQQTRDKDENSKSINDRMNERNFMI